MYFCSRLAASKTMLEVGDLKLEEWATCCVKLSNTKKIVDALRLNFHPTMVLEQATGDGEVDVDRYGA